MYKCKVNALYLDGGGFDGDGFFKAGDLSEILDALEMGGAEHVAGFKDDEAVFGFDIGSEDLADAEFVHVDHFDALGFGFCEVGESGDDFGDDLHDFGVVAGDVEFEGFEGFFDGVALFVEEEDGFDDFDDSGAEGDFVFGDVVHGEA